MSRRFRGLRRDPEVICRTIVPANTVGQYTPQPVATGGSLSATPQGDFLDSGTLAEAVQMGCYVPNDVYQGGIRYHTVHDIFPVVDGQPTLQTFISQRCSQTELMAIPRGWATTPIVPYGLDLISSILTILDAQTAGRPVPSIWLLNTTPKAAKSLVPSVIVQAAELPNSEASIPVAFPIDVYGFQYDPVQLAALLNDLGYTQYGQETGGVVDLPGTAPGTMFRVQMPLLDLSTPAAIKANWPLLSMGLGQAGAAKIYALWRWATNANQTQAGVAYQPRFASAQNPNVSENIQNLYFDFSTAGQEAVVVSGFGVKSTVANNLQNTYIATPNRSGVLNTQIPTWGQLTLAVDNPMNFGEPEQSNSGLYDNIPDFGDGDNTLTSEVAYLTSINTPGQTSPAGSIFWALRGKYATTGSGTKYLGG